jgi:hypothetical protein
MNKRSELSSYCLGAGSIRAKVLLVPLALGLIAAVQSAVALPLNGSFEAPVISGTNDTVPTSWNLAGAGPIQLVSPEFKPFGLSLAASNGAQWVDLTGQQEKLNQGLTQTVSTVAGNFYSVSFDIGNLDYSGYGRGTAQLLIGNLPAVTYFNDLANDGSGVMRWKSFSQTFQASGSETSLTFLAFAVEGNTSAKVIGLDNVTVVPEPEAYGLALAGIGVVAFAMRRRRAYKTA